MKKTLGDITNIRAGYPFRGKISENLAGEARVIQMKDVDLDEGVLWTELITTDLPGKRQPDWLKPGDLLFVARGSHNFVLHLEEVPSSTVLSPHFFHLTVNQNAGILPSFLAWQINQEAAQQYLRKSAEGTQILNIRRKVLEDMPIVVPSLHKQETISQLNRTWQREKQVLQALSDNLTHMMDGLAQQVLREE